MDPTNCTVDAPAKINLSLHVEGRRVDGYHQLSGLVAFASIADELRFQLISETQNAADLESTHILEIQGPFADQLSAPCAIASENLVSKAVRLYCAASGDCRSRIIELQKNLPYSVRHWRVVRPMRRPRYGGCSFESVRLLWGRINSIKLL